MPIDCLQSWRKVAPTQPWPVFVSVLLGPQQIGAEVHRHVAPLSELQKKILRCGTCLRACIRILWPILTTRPENGANREGIG